MKKELLIKVCGMREKANLEAIRRLRPDYIGLIFYEKSPRFVSVQESYLTESFAPIQKVGVFVNELTERVCALVREFHLDAVQLHGAEPADDCATLKQKGVKVIKAFGISSVDDFAQCEPYTSACDMFLFDTKTPAYGGSGTAFDWSILANYTYNVPFLLSGGISLDNLKEINALQHEKFIGIDLNSKFEQAPALKDVAKVQQAIRIIKTSKNE